MTKTVVDVGNCDMDHDSIASLLQANFEVSLLRAHSAAQALELLRDQPVDLVLVNRKLDRDQSEGLKLIQQIKADPTSSDTPCMLVSNFSDAQDRAVAAGAAPGFGKQQLRDPQTKDRLAAFLS